MVTIHSEKTEAITEFPLVDEKRVMPVSVKESTLPDGAATETTLSSVDDALSNAVDGVTRGIKTVDYSHHEIHAGNHFNIASFATLADGANLDFCVTTPDITKRVHMLFQVQGTAQTESYLYEDADLDPDGTPVEPINNDRDSTNKSILTIESGCTVNSVGNLLTSQSFGLSVVPARSFGGAFGRDDELILARNTVYLFRITSRTAGNIVSYRAFWYEHAPVSI